MDYIVTEKYLIEKVNYMNKNTHSFFQVIISTDNDDNYIPSFNFPYEIVNCENNWQLKNWQKYFTYSNPLIFVNTTKMFVKIKNYLVENFPEISSYYTGAAYWAEHFYFNYRDKFWRENRSKFIILMQNEELTSMYRHINAGFYDFLQPIIYEKENIRKLQK